MSGPVNTSNRSVLQDWVHGLTFMMQAVLISAVRGPDGIHKDHVVKVLCRYLRRVTLICAFDGKTRTDPLEEGGGSFTGPCKQWDEHVGKWKVIGPEHALDQYLACVDELPHHFQLHFLHAAEIIGYKHPDPVTRQWWRRCYERLVNDAHLFPETEDQMDARLGDVKSQWRAREEVVAK